MDAVFHPITSRTQDTNFHKDGDGGNKRAVYAKEEWENNAVGEENRDDPLGPSLFGVVPTRR